MLSNYGTPETNVIFLLALFLIQILKNQKLKFCENTGTFSFILIYLCTKDNQLRKYFKEVIATHENQPMSQGSNSRIYHSGSCTKPIIQLVNCATCLIRVHGNLCLCSQNYELIALGLVVTAVLSGNLDHCRVSVIACRKLTIIPENRKILLQIICRLPWTMASVGTCVYLLQPGVCFHNMTPREAAERGGNSYRGRRALSITKPTHIPIAHRDFVNQTLSEYHLQN